MSQIQLNDAYGQHRTAAGLVRSYQGEVELIKRVPGTGQVIETRREKNLIKLFAKEIIAHRLPYSKIWDPNAGLGAGAWVTHQLELDELAPKYICFGASFDSGGAPLDSADSRYYIPDDISGGVIPRSLDVGATHDGGLINAIPIAEPGRPLKRVERIYFEPSYQPAGVPLLQEDVRAVNNVVVLETVLRKDEYNGFGVTDSDFFTLTEVALVAAPEVDSVGACECDPRSIFLEGLDGTPAPCIATGTATVNLSDDVTGADLDFIREGDQVKLTSPDGADPLGQVSPYYLVLAKVDGGRDVVLDRTPVDSTGVPLAGDLGVQRDRFRMFSHRILKTPIKKSEDFELVVRWRIILS